MPASVEEILGPPPSVEDLLGPSPEKKQALARSESDAGAAWWNRADDSLDLAARNWQLEQAGPSTAEMTRVGIIKPNPDFNIAKGEQPATELLDEPLFNLGDFMFKDPKDATSAAEKGVLDTLRPTLNNLTTPKNLGLMAGSMGLAATGQVASRLVAALWAAWMGKDAVPNAAAIGAELGKEFAKPEGERDQRKVAQLLTQGGVDAAFTALPAAHAIDGSPNIAARVAEKFNEAVKNTNFPLPRETLPEAQPQVSASQPGESGGPPTMFVTDADVLAAAEQPKIQPKPAQQNLPRKTFRPKVPETPAEPYETVLQTIRKSGAKTIAEIQALFPRRELTREEARALRDQAAKLPEKIEQEVTEETETKPTVEQLLGPAPKESAPAAEPASEPGTQTERLPTEPGGGAELTIEEFDDGFRLSGIIVPKEERGKGVGTKAMKELIAKADAARKPIFITASAEPGQQERLNAFYERLGFERYKNDPLSGKPMYRRMPKPARGGADPTERAEAARPWDLIDEVEGNVGGLSLESAKKLDPDWSPKGAVRKLFREGGQGIDQAAEAIRRSGVSKLPKDEDLLYELDKAAEARKIWRKDFYKSEQAAEEAAEGQERFERDAGKFKRPHEAIVADELMPGDTFELLGEKVKVKDLGFDEHGDVSHVILEDGTKYGTVQVPGGTVIRMDRDSWETTEGSPEDWNPEAASMVMRERNERYNDLDALARRVHGRPYAELEEWQQDAIRQAVRNRNLSRRQQDTALSGREPGGAGKPVQPGERVESATRPVQQAPTAAGAEQRRVVVPASRLQAGDRITYAGRELVVEAWEPAPEMAYEGWLRIHAPDNPTKWAQVKMDGRDRFTATRTENTPPSSQARSAKTRPASMQLLEKAPPYRAESRTEKALRVQEQEKNGSAPAAKELEKTQPKPNEKWFMGLRRVFAPTTIDDAARTMGGIIRHALGKEYEKQRQADFQLKAAQKEFDRTPVGREWSYEPGMPLPRNYEVMRAIDTGDVSKLTPMEQSFAKVMRRLFDEAIEMVQAVSPNSLRDLIENYFPRIWKDADKYREVVNQLLAKKHWEGPKSFLKKRVLEYFTDGLEMGLQPVSDNPVDVTLLKLGEMYRFATARRAMEEAKATGLRKFVYIYERPPEGWREVKDPSSSLYAPPLVTIKEAYDAQMRAKTIEFLQAIGVPHKRLVQIGGQRWGYAVPPGGGTPRAQSGAAGIQRPTIGGNIVTKFAGPDSVIWHEMGHQMDWKFPELRRLLGATSPRSKLGKQLAALADLRFERLPGEGAVEPSFKRYVREAEEKIANVFEAYLHAPQKFQAAAPDVWNAFEGWLNEHPEVKNPLKEIKPSLRLAESEREMDLGGPVLLGRWMMPDGAAQVVDNYLTPGMGKFKTFRSLREVSGLLNGMQLLGFFHGQFVMNDSFYSGIGLSLYDVLQGNPGRALREIAQIPISPITSIIRGHKIKGAIENPAAANAEYRTLAKLAVEQNLRAGHGNFDPEFSRRWVRAFHEALHEPSAGAVWETFWRAPMAAMQLAMKPVMDLLVPRMKLGIYARMASRVMEDYANADGETLRRKLAEAADATEDRLGQVTYDNLFQSRAVKDVGQLAMRAYGWQLTKYRMIGGGAMDWARAAQAIVKGQKPDVTFRMTYLPAMALGHAILGGMLGYALTGKRPQKLLDYLFPQSGMTDAQGNPVRLSIADFVKDVVADIHAAMTGRPLEEWSRKLAPFWNMAAEMYRNEDFWGTRIFSERQLGEPGLEHLLKNFKEGAEYLAKTALPFSVTAGQRMAKTSQSPKVSTVAPFLGIVPAPRYATQTPAEARASEVMRDMSPRGARSIEQSQHAQDIANIVQDLRLGKINNEGEFERRARQAKVKDEAELTRIKQRVLWTPLQYQVHRMPLKEAMEVFDLTQDKEKASLAKILAEKIQRAWEADKLDQATAKRYVALVKPWYARSGQR